MAGYPGYWNDGIYVGPNATAVANAAARLSGGKRSAEVYGDKVLTAKKADELASPMDPTSPDPRYATTPYFLLVGYGGPDRFDRNAVRHNQRTGVYTVKGELGQTGRGETMREAVDDVNQKTLNRLLKHAARRAA